MSAEAFGKARTAWLLSLCPGDEVAISDPRHGPSETWRVATVLKIDRRGGPFVWVGKAGAHFVTGRKFRVSNGWEETGHAYAPRGEIAPLTDELRASIVRARRVRRLSQVAVLPILETLTDEEIDLILPVLVAAEKRINGGPRDGEKP
jgi:hypothetical protein